MTKFTRDAVSEALHAAVAAKGEEYVYPNLGECRYAEHAGDSIAPSCIVGYVVDALDHDLLENWAEYEDVVGEGFEISEATFTEEYDYEEILDENGDYLHSGEPQRGRRAIDVDATTLDALQVAQSLQDEGKPWGDAEEGFNRVLAGEDWMWVENEILLRR